MDKRKVPTLEDTAIAPADEDGTEKVPNGTKVATNEQGMVQEWIERHEQAGHVLFWCEPISEAIHLIPTNWLDFGKAEYFKSKYSEAISMHLYEKECESMARYLAGQEDF